MDSSRPYRSLGQQKEQFEPWIENSGEATLVHDSPVLHGLV